MEARYKRMLEGMRAKEEGARAKGRASTAGKVRAGVSEAGAPDAGAKYAANAAAAVWSLYILSCSDGSFYTGVTNDLDRRFRMHQDGKASRFTRTRRPVTLVYQETCGTRSQALTRECAVKALGRQGKEKLVAGGQGSPSEPRPARPPKRGKGEDSKRRTAHPKTGPAGRVARRRRK